VEFTINKDDLIACIDKCSTAVPDPKHPTQAFTVMLVDATKKKSVRFAAVGEFCSVDTVADADIKSGGSFNVKPRHLQTVASSMPPGQIKFSLKGTRITVQSMVSKRKASFENHTIDVRPVQDPGRDVAWKTVNAPELLRGLRVAKAASTWYGRVDPVASLLIPTERGLNIFGCNMYLVAEVETSIQIDGGPIVMPASLSALLAFMAPDDENVNLFVDQHRIYMENCDTLVSAQLFDYKFLPNNNFQMCINMMKSPLNTMGPVVSLPKLVTGAKSVLSCTVFAGDKERDSDYGVQLRAVFGESASLSLNLADGDAKDEFSVVTPGSEIDCYISSRLFEQMLASFVGVEEVQVMRAVQDATIMLVLSSPGITYGLMTKEKR
jgi:hypothetical protein